MRFLFIETPNFMRRRDSHFFSDDEFRAFQEELALRPTCWGAMPGCGGIRKARWGSVARGKGKRGGCRIIYLHISIPHGSNTGLIFLIHVYGKNEKDDLTSDEKRILRQLSTQLKNEVDDHWEELL